MGHPTEPFVELKCANCATAEGLGFDFSYAFQPIVDCRDGSVFSYEALVRGPGGESAFSVLERVDEANRYRFDQACRVKAIQAAARLGLPCRLNINFFPNAIYRPELCIRTTLEAARTYGFPIDRLVFELTENEAVEDNAHIGSIINEYRRLGMQTAIDDFGAGYSGLNLLADYQPDYIKLDMKLVRGSDSHPARQVIIGNVVRMARELLIGVVAEGVETAAEYAWLRSAGIHLFQGYYFARPGFDSLPAVPAALFIP
jgi:EAL domain-containing protein (putative c-di-GMP-specific phosphodiesterase class I)